MIIYKYNDIKCKIIIKVAFGWLAVVIYAITGLLTEVKGAFTWK